MDTIVRKNTKKSFDFINEQVNKLITAETGMPVNIANEPLNCVALGTGMVLEEIDKLKNVLISPRKALF